MPGESRVRFVIQVHDESNDESTKRATAPRTENFRKKLHPRPNHGTTCAGNFLKTET